MKLFWCRSRPWWALVERLVREQHSVIVHDMEAPAEPVQIKHKGMVRLQVVRCTSPCWHLALVVPNEEFDQVLAELAQEESFSHAMGEA